MQEELGGGGGGGKKGGGDWGGGCEKDRGIRRYVTHGKIKEKKKSFENGTRVPDSDLESV